jgi:hypothetical protein
MENLYKDKTFYYKLIGLSIITSYLLPLIISMLYIGDWLDIYRIHSFESGHIFLIAEITFISIGISLIIFAATHWPARYAAPLALPLIINSISFILSNEAISFGYRRNWISNFEYFGLYDILPILWSIIFIFLPLLYIAIVKLFRRFISNKTVAAILSVFAISMIYTAVKSAKALIFLYRYIFVGESGGFDRFKIHLRLSILYYILGFLIVLISYFVLRAVIKKIAKNKIQVKIQ